MVGRDRELARVTTLLDGALAGHGRLATLLNKGSFWAGRAPTRPSVRQVGQAPEG